MPERYQRVGYSGWLHTDDGWKPMSAGTALAPAKVAADGGPRHSVRMEVTANPKTATLEGTKRALESLAGKKLHNDATGIDAEINAVQRNKIVSSKALNKSVANGFGANDHNAAASIIDKLWKHAELATSSADESGDHNIRSIKRFVSIAYLGDREAFAYITAKESERDGHRIYSIELEKLEKLEDSLKGRNPSSTSSEDIVAKLREKVNGYTRQSVRLKNYWKVLRGPFDRPLDVDVASAGGYTGIRRELAWGMKLGKMDAISEAARRMAPSIPDDAVVVPMPNHEGRAIRTMLLAYAISGEREVNAPLTLSIGRNRKTSLARR